MPGSEFAAEGQAAMARGAGSSFSPVVADGRSTERLRALGQGSGLVGEGRLQPGPGGAHWLLRPGEAAPREAVCALGAFDGVHRGHRELLREARDDARRLGVPLVAVTFDPDPSAVVGGQPQPALLSCERRRRLLLEAPVDAVLWFSFTPQVAGLEYQAFLHDLLWPAVRPRAIHVGEGFRLGARGAGTVDRIAQVGRQEGFSTVAHPLLYDRGTPVSASRIRHHVEAGEVARARELLGHAAQVQGRVAHGRGEGASLGFPTANIQADADQCLPAPGVYAAGVWAADRLWPAAVNVGAPPTFTDRENPALMEATLLGFEGDLYGQPATVLLAERLREARPFDSVEELQEAVQGNLKQTAALLGREPVAL